MRAESVTVVLDAPKMEVFDFLSRVESMPVWATEFARELKWEGGCAKVVNGLGEFWIHIDADPDTGVIDMRSGPEPDALALFPSRVVGLPDDRSAFTFTMFQPSEMPDALFESQHASLVRELDGLRVRFAVTA
ncbi:MAG TPA: hypothetical protein VFN06_02285 [Gaiellaceae bacterium]|nr:hypothetical protein [Gaiellaceae bacterium]